MRSRQRKIYPRLEWLVRSGDKAAIARSFQGMASSGMVYIPNCEWGDRLIDQLCKFPTGKYDDAVDVCALMALAIQMAHPAIMHDIDSKPKRRDTWGRPSRGGDTWQTM
jgi:phage terminase large subunit-like protein